jgi:hypothetical protein
MSHPVARRFRRFLVAGAGALLLGTLGLASVASADEIGGGAAKPAAAQARADHVGFSNNHASRASADHGSLPRMSRGGMPRNMPHVSRR